MANLQAIILSLLTRNSHFYFNKVPLVANFSCCLSGHSTIIDSSSFLNLRHPPLRLLFITITHFSLVVVVGFSKHDNDNNTLVFTKFIGQCPQVDFFFILRFLLIHFFHLTKQTKPVLAYLYYLCEGKSKLQIATS